MDNKELNLEQQTEEIKKYFQDDLDAIEEELKKSKEYSVIIDAEINRLAAPGLTTKGSQHYLIEHITNAVQLQTQRQGLRKDRVAIKKLILDYTNRNLDRNLKLESLDSESNAALTEAIKKFIENDVAAASKKVQNANPQELDSKIDEILNSTEKDGD